MNSTLPPPDWRPGDDVNVSPAGSCGVVTALSAEKENSVNVFLVPLMGGHMKHIWNIYETFCFICNNKVTLKHSKLADIYVVYSLHNNLKAKHDTALAGQRERLPPVRLTNLKRRMKTK
jgi:hypothetical protein